MNKECPTKKQLNTFVFGLAMIISLFAFRAHKAENYKISILLLFLGLLLIFIYFIKKDFVVKFYKVWMKCASFIGAIITGILIIFIFYLVFTPVGIFLRIIKKDVLNLKKDPKLDSYWIDKPEKVFDKSDYERQF
jgi:hypothetical protein